jgi:hypothetical protein
MHRAVRQGPDMTGPVRSSAGMVSGPRDHPRPRHKDFQSLPAGRPESLPVARSVQILLFLAFLPPIRVPTLPSSGVVLLPG